MKLIDMSGRRFGRLLVLSKDQIPRMWRCQCECGATKLVAGSNLRNGSIRSCGCLATEWSKYLGANPEFVAKRASSTARHGHKRRSGASREYKTWIGMKRRCEDPGCKDFPRWGGRGIRVCERWQLSFEAFLSDMGPKPSPSHSIDRIDGTGHYEPGNCRWSTPKEQGVNRRNVMAVTVGGERFSSVTAAAIHFGVGITTAWQRIEAGIEPAIAVSHVGRLRPRRSGRPHP